VLAVTVVAGWTGAAAAGNHSCPPEPELEESPSSQHWLEGTIGPSAVRLHLERGGKVVVGVY
jgi:hypothetical protein